MRVKNLIELKSTYKNNHLNVCRLIAFGDFIHSVNHHVQLFSKYIKLGRGAELSFHAPQFTTH